MAISNYERGALVEVLDADTGLYTRYNGMGTVAVQRPLTATELAAVQAHDHAQDESNAVAKAQQTVDNTQQQQPSFQQQIQADITTVQAGWQTLTADQQTQILLRVLNGFTSVMDGLQAHATVTGAIDPLAP